MQFTEIRYLTQMPKYSRLCNYVYLVPTWSIFAGLVTYKHFCSVLYCLKIISVFIVRSSMSYSCDMIGFICITIFAATALISFSGKFYNNNYVLTYIYIEIS